MRDPPPLSPTAVPRRASSRPGLQWLADALAPRCCAGCGAAGSALCARCRDRIGRLAPPEVRGCHAAFPFAGTVREVIHNGKFRDGRSGLATLARLAAARLEPGPGVLVTPVPLSPRRLRERGYNQAELVAGVLAARWGRPLDHLLLRVLDTHPQSRLDGPARRRNVRSAFAPAPGAAERIAGGPVCLVDDVRTTGATAAAAAAALEAAGAEAVVVAVLAAVP